MPAHLPVVRLIANNDEVMIMWKYGKVIKNCYGFAIYKKKKCESDAVAEPLRSTVGFEGEKHKDGQEEPTTVWPLQAYSWIDYTANTGDELAYRVVPMLNNGTPTLVKDEANATAWSSFIKVEVTDTKDISFNRGLIASQFMAKIFANTPENERSKSLEKHIADPNSPVRNFLGGDLLLRLYALLDEVAKDKSLQLYASLYEIDDTEIIKRLNAIGKRVNLILANGAFDTTDNDPQKANAAALNKINVTRRIVPSPHFAHHKYFVVTKKTATSETPVKVFTGSTNITRSGLFTQINNCIILNDKATAAYYFEQWKILKADCDKDGKGLYGKSLSTYNNIKRENANKKISTWFAPVLNKVDLTDATTYIKNAKQGILFLMFKPGGLDSITLYNEIYKRRNDDVLIHGIMNSDPGGKEHPTIEFIHKGIKQAGNFEAALPAHIAETGAFWMKEIGQKTVSIHSKLIVIDPFSKNPVVLTGSHNMGEKASRSNDDNLNILLNNKDLAVGYALGILGVYKHYRWRYYRSKMSKALWNGLRKNDAWQGYYISGDGKKEIEFWMP